MTDDLKGYKCPNCGAPLVFKGDVQKMVCEFCDSSFEMSEFAGDAKHKGDVQEGEWQQEDKGHINEEGMLEYVCKSCGAALITQQGTGATECPYCGNPVVISNTFSGMDLPDGVLPFAVDKKSAKDALLRFYSDKKLLPDNFKDNNHLDNISGIYVPFWLFDCKADGNGFFKATKERTVTRNGKEQKEIQEYRVLRSGTMDFKNVPADGSKEMDDSYMDSLEPFDYSKMTDYNPAYLSGYLANKYDEDKNDVRERVDSRMRATVETELRKTVTGYTSVNTQACDVAISDARIRYCMLPVWMLATKYNNQVFSFAMNGQTGAVTGNLPIDKGKCTKLFWTTTLVCALIASILVCFIDELFSTTEVIALGIAVMIGFIRLSSEKSKMTAHKGSEASRYLVRDSLKITNRQDKHVNTRYEDK
ncbi:MAG: DNA-directed RNA polymerase subunit P [Firmicutes bacterium ADurb.Bin354]|nr:MAG: DNA-directed RNA polymerase subunit P [Firmicutes bacterium ADurb.Bin354]